MDDGEHLRRELRAAREELVRRGPSDPGELDDDGTPIVPDRDEAYLRLALLSRSQLERHVERLERDLEDLEATEHAGEP